MFKQLVLSKYEREFHIAHPRRFYLRLIGINHNYSVLELPELLQKMAGQRIKRILLTGASWMYV
jgi:hypothetical protein